MIKLIKYTSFIPKSVFVHRFHQNFIILILIPKPWKPWENAGSPPHPGSAQGSPVGSEGTGGSCRIPPWPNSSTSTVRRRSWSRGSAPPPTSRNPRVPKAPWRRGQKRCEPLVQGWVIMEISGVSWNLVVVSWNLVVV